MTTLGQRIQALRKEAGLSQEALGETLHVSRQAVSKWEGDGGVPELDTLIQMSRLFHVRLEMLLGLESAPEEAAPEAENPAEESAETPAFSPDAEQRLEALLQRYSQQQSAPRRTVPLWAKIASLAAAAGILLAVFLIPAANNQRLRRELADVRNRLSTLESSVSHQSSSLRSTILSVLEEQNDPVSSMDIQVSGCDYSAGTVTLSLSAQLKSVAPETQVQFLLQWTDESGQTQQDETAWVSAYPNAQSQFTLPLYESDAQLCYSLRLRDAEGTVQHSSWKSAGLALSREAFQLALTGSLQALTSLTYSSSFGTSTTTTAESPLLTVYAPLPQLQPEAAVYTLWLEDTLLYQETLTVSHTSDMDAGRYRLTPGSPEDFPLKLQLQKGQTLTYQLQILDNYEQETTFRSTCTAGDSGLEWEEALPVSVPPDTN